MQGNQSAPAQSPEPATAIINAAGPSVLDLYARAGVAAHKKMRLVRGSHIVVRRMFDHDYAYFFQLPDGRIFFAIPYERDFTLIGTTDLYHPDAQVQPKASDEEIAYLCEGANQYFECAITPQDVVWTYSGVRPLIDDGSGKPEAATRGYTFDVSGGADDVPVMLSVFGGKITTYRHLATDALALLAEHVAVGGRADWTAHAPLPGGDFPMQGLPALMEGLARDYPFLPPATVDRIARAYGTKARDWLGQAEGLNDLGPHFGAGLTGAEVDYLMTREWAQTADDVLWRRSKLGLRMDAAGVAALDAHMAAKSGTKTHAG